MATENENLKAMRQAADFVRKHHDVLRQALISEALALEEQASYGSRISWGELGGCGEAGVFVEPAGASLVPASPGCPVGGVQEGSGQGGDRVEQVFDLGGGQRDEAGC